MASPVVALVTSVLRFLSWYEVKNHSRSLMIGPPSVNAVS
jgi:hypothetical protein